MAHNGFSLARKRIGVYFSDAHHITWVQQDKDATQDDVLLLEAIQAARKTFNSVYFPKRLDERAATAPTRTECDPKQRSEGLAWASGYNYGLDGPNDSNCHFSNFATPEMTAAWEKGKLAGEASRANEVLRPAAAREAKR